MNRATGSDSTDNPWGWCSAYSLHASNYGCHMAQQIPWRIAWERSQLGADGFYRRADTRSRDHFRTSSHVGEPLALAMCALLGDIDARLYQPARLDLVDVGAGEGELLSAVVTASRDFEWSDRLRPLAIDVRPRPNHLNPAIGWLEGLAPDVVPAGLRGLLVASELLDDVPCDVVVTDDYGDRRVVLVDSAGRESVGECASPATTEWLDWWRAASRQPGARAEVGTTRDRMCRELVDRVEHGMAVFIDYSFNDEPFTQPTLVGYQHGRLVRPIPDGRCNLTAHVELRSCAAAVAERGDVQLLRQAAAVHALVPEQSGAGIAEMSFASQLDESTALRGLGAHQWLTVGIGDYPGCEGLSRGG